jgi:hypothetical protein
MRAVRQHFESTRLATPYARFASLGIAYSPYPRSVPRARRPYVDRQSERGQAVQGVGQRCRWPTLRRADEKHLTVDLLTWPTVTSPRARRGEAQRVLPPDPLAPSLATCEHGHLVASRTRSGARPP